MFKLTSLNLNGIRSATSKGLADWVAAKAPDCMCVQELKAQATDIAGRFERIADLQGYFHCADKKGYSGVGVYTRHEPSDVIIGFDQGEFDAEGRCIELRFDTPAAKRSILSVYFPSGSSSEERQEAKYRFLDLFYPYLMRLRAERAFILCGDVNIAHQEIDLKNWRSNQKNSGFLPQERAWMTRVLTEGGLVDVYRHLHPNATADSYTWWSNRGQAWANNVGWRIDYQLATAAWGQTALQAEIEKQQRFSDHAPLTMTYSWGL